jgi:hypothetical protein
MGHPAGAPLTEEERLQAVFTGLGSARFDITSSSTHDYNCVGWALGRSDEWWGTDPFSVELGLYQWMAGVPLVDTLDSWSAIFESIGYRVGEPDTLEAGFEKIAIFGRSDGPQHVARQLPSGRWTSKLGRGVDIEHDLRDLEGDRYGSVVRIMTRATKLPDPNAGT